MTRKTGASGRWSVERLDMSAYAVVTTKPTRDYCVKICTASCTLRLQVSGVSREVMS